MAILLLPIALAGCLPAATTSRSISYTGDRGVANQPFPNNYRAELLAFMKTYLNNPAGVHDAVMAEPVQRTVGGRLRYVSLPAFFAARIRRQLSRAARARHLSMSMAGSTIWSKMPASSAPARSMRRFRNWKR